MDEGSPPSCEGGGAEGGGQGRCFDEIDMGELSPAVDTPIEDKILSDLICMQQQGGGSWSNGGLLKGVQATVNSNYKLRKSQLRKVRELNKAIRKARRKTLLKSAKSVCERVEDLMYTCDMRDSLYKRKIAIQSSGVERR